MKRTAVDKRYLFIDQQIARHLCIEWLYTPLPFYKTQIIITLFLLKVSQQITIKGLEF